MTPKPSRFAADAAPDWVELKLDAYRSAQRVGRGVVLSRAKRDAIWPVFEEYRAQCSEP